jgi:hypothetical protein
MPPTSPHLDPSCLAVPTPSISSKRNSLD